MEEESIDLGIQDTVEIDYDIDFDIGDFDIIEEKTPTRIIKPKISSDSVRNFVSYKRAEELSEKIDLRKGSRTTCIVPGNFIFGDLIESLVYKREVGVKNLYISTLSLSQDNVDSLKNVVLRAQPENVGIVLSGYFYSHEKFGLVPYLYNELDDGSNRFQCAFTNTHMKIVTIETWKGNHYVIHGSANLRSSNSIEQFDFEENQELYDFYARMLKEQLDLFGTIDFTVPKKVRSSEVWQAVQHTFSKKEE